MGAALRSMSSMVCASSCLSLVEAQACSNGITELHLGQSTAVVLRSSMMRSDASNTDSLMILPKLMLQLAIRVRHMDMPSEGRISATVFLSRA